MKRPVDLERFLEDNLEDNLEDELNGSTASGPWAPSSWRAKPIRQAFVYPNADDLAKVEMRLSEAPPMVFETELDQLRDQLSRVERGEAFFLQGGDCAESFSDQQPETTRDNYHLILRMEEILRAKVTLPVVKVGRMAGQFAKPRSVEVEADGQGGVLPVYRGDMVNGFNLNLKDRTLDPTRLEKAYFHSVNTSNWLRDLAAENKDPQGEGRKLFTSHEALHLPYEQAMTRASKFKEGRFYAGSAHMLWIGDRTRQLSAAHVEFARGILNPIGLKCGPDLGGDELLSLVDRLNPENQSGRLTLITRFGAKNIGSLLPPLIRRVQQEGRRVVWCCDPMHGNTYLTNLGIKTRSVREIQIEIQTFVEVHRAEGSFPGGIHLELTGRPVFECVMGEQNINEETQFDARGYQTLCDPRLNETQALALASTLGSLLSRPRFLKG